MHILLFWQGMPLGRCKKGEVANNEDSPTKYAGQSLQGVNWFQSRFIDVIFLSQQQNPWMSPLNGPSGKGISASENTKRPVRPHSSIDETQIHLPSDRNFMILAAAPGTFLNAIAPLHLYVSFSYGPSHLA